MPLDPLPEFRSIAGSDLHPIDTNDPDERLWLRSLVWPNAPHRRAPLDAAFSVIEQHEIRVDNSDANGWIEFQLSEPPQSSPIVVFHAAVRIHMPPEFWSNFYDGLVQLSDSRPVYHISLEGDVANQSGLQARSPFILEVQRIPEPPLAIAALDGHATWIAPLAT